MISIKFRRSFRIRIILIMAILFCTVYFYLGISIPNPVDKRYDEPMHKDVCTSKECTRLAEYLVSVRNMSTDPCEDFNQHTCGCFPLEHPSLKNVISIVNHVLINDSMKFFKTDEAPDELKSVRQSRNMFQACIDKDTRNKHGYKPIFEMLPQLRLPDIPTFFTMSKKMKDVKRTALDWIETDAMANKLLDLYLFIQCDVDEYFNNINCNIPGNKMIQPHSDSWEDDFNKSMNERLEFMNFTITTLYREKYKKLPFDFNERLSDAMDRIIDIEIKIEQTRKENKFNVDKITLNDNTYVNKIWKKYLHTLFHGLNVTLDLDIEEIHIEDMSYFESIFHFLKEESEENLELWVWWKVVYYLMPQTTTEAVGYAEKIFQTSDANLKILSEESCLNLTIENMEHAVAYGVMGKSIQTQKMDILNMWNDIKEAFNIRVNSIPWLDTTTKNNVLDKLRGMKILIGFSETIEDDLEKIYSSVSINDNTGHLYNVLETVKLKKKLSLERLHKSNETLIDFPPMLVNAFYIRTKATIHILPGIINFPFYNRGSDLLNYATFGFILGHELIHGFDSDERKYDANRNLNLTMRNSSADEEYQERESCFVQQYNNFLVPEINEFVEGEFTLAENIADNGGLHLAYDAYLKKKRNTSTPMLKLPGLENYTHEQLFFILFASTFCSQNSISEVDLFDTHSPNRYRILGIYQNSEEFASAFNCSVGSKMNPVDKCKIW